MSIQHVFLRKHRTQPKQLQTHLQLFGFGGVLIGLACECDLMRQYTDGREDTMTLVASGHTVVTVNQSAFMPDVDLCPKCKLYVDDLS